MKIKARLQCFSALGDDADDSLPHHKPLSYEGICDEDSIQGKNFCLDRPTKCLHGIFDKKNVDKNIRHVD